MVSYHKQRAKWERENRAAKRAGPTLTFHPDKSGGFSIPEIRRSGVPSVGKPMGTPSFSVPANRPFKEYEAYGGPKGVPFGGLMKYRSIGQGVLGFLLDNADELQKWGAEEWDAMHEGRLPNHGGMPDWAKWLAEHDIFGNPMPRPVVPGQVETPDVKEPSPNGDFWFYGVDSGVLCNRQVARAPGKPGPFKNQVYVMKHEGHTGPGYTNCNTIVSSNGSLKEGYSPNVPPYYAFYTAVKYNSLPLPEPGGAPWMAWKFPGGAPSRNPSWDLVPTGSPMPTRSTPARFAYMPGQPWSGYDAPSQRHINVPNRARAAFKFVQLLAGNRYDSGYDTDPRPTLPSPSVVATISPGGGGSITRPTNPEPPYNPGGKRDKKVRLQGYLLFRAVQKIFHGITEFGDLTESLYEALPKNRQTCKIGGPACEAHMIAKYWDEIDPVEAVVNVIANQIEDALLGRFYGGVDNAARRLGSHGYKFLNSALDEGLDNELGELYKEFAGDYVAPAKKEIVSRVKDIFGVP